jgi:transcriptional regulator with PAS, ATPase and Fis domain
MPADLLESELFGHVKGAFTGAVKDHTGIFRAASGGTLLLDEVAEMPLPLQAKLLRVLETKSVLPVGSTTPIPVDVRIISATHQSLREGVQQGTFRADLMFRLRVVPIFLPALRERGRDIAVLLKIFMQDLNRIGLREGTRVVDRIGRTAMQRLTRYSWPGNVRELRNALEYAYVIGEGATLVESDLPPELLDEPSAKDGDEAAATPPLAATPSVGPSVEAAQIQRALQRSAGNRQRAAAMLGMSRITLWRRMTELGIAAPR